MLIERDKTQLLVVDEQERLIPAMHEGARVVERTALLLQAARTLGLPVTVTEQYPQGLGPTVPQLLELLPSREHVFAKTQFSAAAQPAVAARLADLSRPQVVIAGVEAHVCVAQTATMLRASGYDVFLVADAVSSRRTDSVTLAFERLKPQGIWIVNVEQVLFECLGEAGTPAFRELSKLIR
ncbi:isochorismatase family protein [Vineibacter terrae]|uniref:isochorismatase family protein n=1 Tax=Vineibacter terrae TaxID=2586908 RepID=UPI002E321301|nr:isochorismatase family protein [Vineibacter terrae]HEX2889156.1 isochorismatase family protein [Vineibacter terrae]